MPPTITARIVSHIFLMPMYPYVLSNATLQRGFFLPVKDKTSIAIHDASTMHPRRPVVIRASILKACPFGNSISTALNAKSNQPQNQNQSARKSSKLECKNWGVSNLRDVGAPLSQGCIYHAVVTLAEQTESTLQGRRGTCILL